MKRAIFTFYNLSIDKEVIRLQHEVIQKLNKTADFLPLCSQTHGEEVIHPDGVEYGFHQLFQEYDTVLLLDVDCIPLNQYALEYTFEQAESGKLIGNAQIGAHLQNPEHLYVAPSAFCLTRKMFEDFGRLTFKPDHYHADTCGFYTLEAEKRGVEVEFYMPTHFQRPPRNAVWDLGQGRGQYGIGTTYSNHLGVNMFYHLFESRLNVYNCLFYDKCEELLK
jgi:hypothetical protein